MTHVDYLEAWRINGYLFPDQGKEFVLFIFRTAGARVAFQMNLILDPAFDKRLNRFMNDGLTVPQYHKIARKPVELVKRSSQDPDATPTGPASLSTYGDPAGNWAYITFEFSSLMEKKYKIKPGSGVVTYPVKHGRGFQRPVVEFDYSNPSLIKGKVTFDVGAGGAHDAEYAEAVVSWAEERIAIVADEEVIGYE